MKYLSICSGIEAATVAWHPLGWEPVAFAEIEAFPAAVLAHHYPGVPNLGDMTKFKEWQVDAFDVLVGGTPCQAFSVAGLRQSLDDARGNLSLVFCEMADHFDPPYILWENVPGVLNTKDNAFGCFLAGLAGEDVPLVAPGGKWTNAGFVLGPKRNVAWRVLDAQYFGLAQRRRRVFVVACPRNGADPREILFEREGVQRHSAPSREKGKGITGVAGTLSANRGGLDRQAGNANELDFCVPTYRDVSPTLTNKMQGSSGWAPYNEDAHLVPVCVCVAFHQNQRAEVTLNDTAGSLKVGGGKPGQGYPAVMTCARQEPDTLLGQGINQGGTHARAQERNPRAILRALWEEIGEEAFTEWGLGILVSFYPPEILRQAVHGRGLRCPTLEEFGLVYYSLSREEAGAERAVRYLRETKRQGRTPFGWEPHEQRTRELAAYLSKLSQPGTSGSQVLRDLWSAAQGPGLLRETLSAIQEVGRPDNREGQPAHAMQVRRLVCEECEALQGFPRNYTRIPWRNKPAEDCPDGPRYKALGNSMAVPCMRWIGQRIQSTLNHI